ncbi:MAG TPA: hypothetical protein VHL09_12275 [Dehalococcoidia bacterium]|nr:hypothetical protein [Dehalococcoidia bacterium]
MNDVAENPAVPVFRRTLQIALIVGIVGLILTALGLILSPNDFFRAYLMAYVWAFSIAQGCLFLGLVHNVVGGWWGYAIRRFLEAGMGVLPLLAVLFLPILLGLGSLYPWTQADVVQSNPLLQHKQVYLNVPFFIARAVVFWAIWLALAYFLRKWSMDRDRTGSPVYSRRMTRLGAVGVILWALTCTFAYYDWVMSTDPIWFSSIYGATLGIPGVLAALSLIVFLISRVIRFAPLDDALPPKAVNDLGNLMLGFTIISMYLAFSQFLIIWSANLTEEVIWYIHRWDGGWQWVALYLAIFHFMLPLAVLVSRHVKRDIGLLAIVAANFIWLRVVDLWWQIQPNFSPNALSLSWVHIVAPIGIGGVWLALYLWQLGRRPLLPLYLPPKPERYHGPV